ncbi:hypothetical protein Tco_0352439 [Tanacetum coccineum]
METTTKDSRKDYGTAEKNLALGPKSEDSFYAFATQGESARAVYSTKKTDTLLSLKKVTFHRIRSKTLEDMLLILVQEKVTNLSVEESVLQFNVSHYECLTRRVVIQMACGDLQKGVESYRRNSTSRSLTRTVRLRFADPHDPARTGGSTKGYPLVSVEVLRTSRVNSFTMKMEILLESTSNKLMVAGNPVKKILLKLNLSDHRLYKNGGGGRIREMSQSLSSNVPDNSPEQEATTGHSIPRRLDSPTSQATQLPKLELTLTHATGHEHSQEINNLNAIAFSNGKPASETPELNPEDVTARLEDLEVEVDTLHVDTEDKELLISELQDSLAAVENEIAIL